MSDVKILKKTRRMGTLVPIKGHLFDSIKIRFSIPEIEIKKSKSCCELTKNNKFQLQNRRYIGSKHKLLDRIFSIIKKECKGNSFADIFAGTGIVGAMASKYFNKIVLNDFLDSNYIIYQAFFSNDVYSEGKIEKIIKKYNNLNANDLEENYFSQNFGGKYFNEKSAKIIGYIRENIEKNKKKTYE